MSQQQDPGMREAAVSAWFAENIAGVSGPVAFERVAGGRSNLTYRASDAAGTTDQSSLPAPSRHGICQGG